MRDERNIESKEVRDSDPAVAGLWGRMHSALQAHVKTADEMSLESKMMANAPQGRHSDPAQRNRSKRKAQ